MNQIQKATHQARRRTGDRRIGVRAQRGKMQLVRVEYEFRGQSSVTELTDFMAPADVVRALEAYRGFAS